MKKAVRRLVVANAVLAVVLGFGVLFAAQPLPALAEAKPWEVAATIRTLGFAYGSLGLALWFLGAPASVDDRRRLALGLGAGNLIAAGMIYVQQTQIWGAAWGWILVLLPAVLAAGFLWLAFRRPDPEEEVLEAEPSLSQIRESWLRQIGEAAAQEERNRLARDLHDSIKQQLFSIHVGTAAAQERWERDPEGSRKALADVRRCAHEAMVEMQALLHQLRPEALAAAGLVEALREHCEAHGYRTGAEVKLELGEWAADERLAPGTQETLFRIAQEALANVARHARAHHVRVVLGQSGDMVHIRVQDDGQGFEPATAERGMGLRNLEERAQALRGRCAVESAPGAGTTVSVTIPLLAPPQVPESAARKALRWESWGLVLPLAWAVLLFFLGRDASAGLIAFGAGATVPLLAFAALHSRLKVQEGARSVPGNPSFVVRLRRAGHRHRGLLFLVGIWAFPWHWRLADEGWSTQRIAWAAVSLICAGLAAVEIAGYHRTRGTGSSLRGRFSWPDASSAAAVPLAVAILLGSFFAFLILPQELIHLLATREPGQLGLLLTLAAAGLYGLWREKEALA